MGKDDDTVVGVVDDDETMAEDDKFNPLIVAVCELCWRYWCWNKDWLDDEFCWCESNGPLQSRGDGNSHNLREKEKWIVKIFIALIWNYASKFLKHECVNEIFYFFACWYEFFFEWTTERLEKCTC